ncbi:MAG: 16S rRNA (adenine(1518)-N(6)/adenine(1519)-N(6))-dimethyltransferase RsmA [Actinomycetota bacterium]
MTRQSRSEILRLMERHGLSPRKAYGQHFLADANLIAKMVAVANVAAGDSVVEVGAGTGALTRALADTGATVVAFEIDPQLRPVLEEVLGGSGVRVEYRDVMDVDLRAELAGGPWKLVSNLPYNIGTPLLMEILQHVPTVTSTTVMVQREVADRLVARPGTPEYGFPSVVVSLTARLVEQFQVPPQVFVPAPAVSSKVLRLDRIDPPSHLAPALELARLAFGQRRKMLRRSLRNRVEGSAYRTAGVDDTSRPEDLAPSRFVDLAEAVADG